MAIYLDEDEVDDDPNLIGYPHLLLCIGTTLLLADGSLAGAHVTSKQHEDEPLTGLRTLVKHLKQSMMRMYVTGNFKKHLGENTTKAQIRQDAGEKAKKLGYNGVVYAFNTSVISPRDGTYVEVASNGPTQQCTVQYKRDEKMDRERMTRIGGAVKNSPDGRRLKIVQYKNVGIIVTPSNKGQLHTVRQFMTFNV